jgi:hypothetical protein
MSIDPFVSEKSMLYEIGVIVYTYVVNECVIIYLWWYVCIHVIACEFMNMNELVRLFECFNMMIIGELHVLW